MSRYSMEELLPVVAKLTQKYTGFESTSVTYEKAQQLMSAVLYCIKQGEANSKNNTEIMSDKMPSAQTAYEYGYQKVIEKAREAQKLYSDMIINFCAYGNRNYKDTVEKAIPGFFKYYDARFAPQNTIITMDYPTLQHTAKLSAEGRGKSPSSKAVGGGINIISRYVEDIAIEQKFLSYLPEEYIYDTLKTFDSSYKEQFYNICQIVLRRVLGSAITRQAGYTSEYFKKMYEYIENNGASGENMREILHIIIEKNYDGDKRMFEYLSYDIENFCVELSNAANNRYLENVFKISD